MSATVKRIDDGSVPSRRRYRVEGSDIAPEWAQRLEERKRAFPCDARPAVPSCEFTVWYQGNTLGSYGGTVLPTAWPALFEFHRGTAQTGSCVSLTADGLRLVSEAERAWEREREGRGGYEDVAARVSWHRGAS